MDPSTDTAKAMNDQLKTLEHEVKLSNGEKSDSNRATPRDAGRRNTILQLNKFINKAAAVSKLQAISSQDKGDA